MTQGRIGIAGLSGLIALGLSLPVGATEIAYGGAGQPSVGVMARIVSGCSIANRVSAAGSMDFGSFNFGSHPVSESQDQATSASGGDSGNVLRCTPPASVTITVSAGSHGDASGQRYMANGKAQIPYDLWLDSSKNTKLISDQARTVSLPNGTMSLSLSGLAKLSLVDESNRIAGTYSDVVSVTLDF